jgi:hypothetical protein
MAEGKSVEATVLANYEGEFRISSISTKTAKDGNKIRIMLEGKYSVEVMAFMSAFLDRDAKVRFKEMASKKMRKAYGEEDTLPLPL